MHPDVTYLTQQYYTALDHHGYDMLRNLLEPESVQHRGSMTLSGHEELATFMRDDQPQKDTQHVIERCIQSRSDDEITIRGHLEDGDNDELFVSLDRFRAHDGKLLELKTFVKSSTANWRDVAGNWSTRVAAHQTLSLSYQRQPRPHRRAHDPQ